MLDAFVFAIMSPRNNKLAPSLKFVRVDQGGGWGGGLGVGREKITLLLFTEVS